MRELLMALTLSHQTNLPVIEYAFSEPLPKITSCLHLLPRDPAAVFDRVLFADDQIMALSRGE